MATQPAFTLPDLPYHYYALEVCCVAAWCFHAAVVCLVFGLGCARQPPLHAVRASQTRGKLALSLMIVTPCFSPPHPTAQPHIDALTMNLHHTKHHHVSELLSRGLLCGGCCITAQRESVCFHTQCISTAAVHTHAAAVTTTPHPPTQPPTQR